jgi:hypothetical protein
LDSRTRTVSSPERERTALARPLVVCRALFEWLLELWRHGEAGQAGDDSDSSSEQMIATAIFLMEYSYSIRSLAFAAAFVCHCILDG